MPSFAQLHPNCPKGGHSHVVSQAKPAGSKSAYNSFVATQLKKGGAGDVCPNPKVNMAVAAARWSAAKKQ